MYLKWCNGVMCIMELLKSNIRSVLHHDLAKFVQGGKAKKRSIPLIEVNFELEVVSGWPKTMGHWVRLDLQVCLWNNCANSGCPTRFSLLCIYDAEMCKCLCECPRSGYEIKCFQWKSERKQLENSRKLSGVNGFWFGAGSINR